MTDFILGILQLRVSLDRHSETKLINTIRTQEEQLLLILYAKPHHEATARNAEGAYELLPFNTVTHISSAD